MGNLWFKDFLVYSIIIFVVAYVTYVYNYWGTGKGNDKAKGDTKKAKKVLKKRNKTIKRLNTFEYIGKNIGFEPKHSKLKDYEYRLARMGKEIKVLNRSISNLELIGLMKLIKFIGCALGVLGWILTGSKLFILCFLSLGVENLFLWRSSNHITDEDLDIETEFPSLYLLLCTQLYNGAYSRLTPTLDNYLKSLDSMYGNTSHRAIKTFVLDMRKNIEIYGDDSMSVNKLREKYRSAMVINFCNLAVQSLSGVDNKDKLISFKVELQSKQLKAMEEVAERRLAKGRRAIWVVYLILGQFVALSWVSKLGGVDLGFFTQFF